MRRFAAVLLSLVLLVTMAATGFAASDVRVLFDEQAVQFDANPFIEDGRTLVPVRALAERLGFTVGWDQGEQKITLTKGERTILLWIGSTKVVVNGKEGKVDVAPKQVNNRTFVPVRFVAEQLGAHVAWDGNQQAAVVTSGKSLLLKLNKELKLVDQKLSADLQMQMEMGGTAMGDGGSITVKVPAHLDLHLYQNDVLAHVSFQLPAIMGMPDAGAVNVDFAVKDGKAYARESNAGQWDELGDFDLAKTMRELSAQLGESGFADLQKLQSEVLQDAVITVAGEEEMDGVKVVRLDVDLSKLKFQELIDKMFYNLPSPADQMPDVKIKVDRYLIQLWINPDTEFMHKATSDIAMSTSIIDSSETMTVNMAIKGELRATPVSEPIKFPDFSAPAFTPEQRLAAKLYWDAFGKKVAPDGCGILTDEADAHWTDKSYTAGHDAAVKAVACFTQQRQVLAALTPPTDFAEGHKLVSLGIENSEKAYTFVAEGFELAAKGDMTTANARKADGQKLSATGMGQVVRGSSLLFQVATKYKLFK